MSELLRKLVPLESLKQTVSRFPLPSICSLLVFVVLLLATYEFIDMEENDLRYVRVLLLFIFGFFWFGLAKLYEEYLITSTTSGVSIKTGSKKLKYPIVIVSLSSLLIFVLFFFISFYFTAHYFFWTIGLLIAVLLLSIGVGSNLFHQHDSVFWAYNFRIWLGSLIASLAGIIWGAGLSLAFASIQYLFEVDMPDDSYQTVWMFAMSIFVPLYALSWIPETKIEEEKECHAPIQLTFILNWVLAPLLIFYLFILYAYFFKIALAQELPRGQLSYMVSAFGSIGLLTYLAGWPVKDTGNGLLKLVYRYFFPALLIPAFVQGLSIYTRIEQYGITESRYLVVLFVLWFGVLSIAFSIKRFPLKYIPGSLALLLVVFAIGPFSAPLMSVKSQVNRLDSILAQKNLLEDGVIAQSEQSLAFETRLNISSILRFLETRDRLNAIEYLLPSNIEENNLNANYISQLLGFNLVDRYMAGMNFETINIGSIPNQVYVVAGFDYLVMQQSFGCPMQGCEALSWNYQIENGPVILTSLAGEVLSIVIDSTEEINFNLAEMIVAELITGNTNYSQSIELESSNNIYKVKLLINNLSAVTDIDTEPDNPDYRIQSMFYSILIDE